MNVAFKKIIFTGLFVASAGAMEEKNRIVEKQKRSTRPNSFFGIPAQQSKHESRHLPDCCMECCYLNRFCLPVYYLLSCIIGPDEQVPLDCCCCSHVHDTL